MWIFARLSESDLRNVRPFRRQITYHFALKRHQKQDRDVHQDRKHFNKGVSSAVESITHDPLSISKGLKALTEGKCSILNGVMFVNLPSPRALHGKIDKWVFWKLFEHVIKNQTGSIRNFLFRRDLMQRLRFLLFSDRRRRFEGSTIRLHLKTGNANVFANSTSVRHTQHKRLSKIDLFGIQNSVMRPVLAFCRTIVLFTIGTNKYFIKLDPCSFGLRNSSLCANSKASLEIQEFPNHPDLKPWQASPSCCIFAKLQSHPAKSAFSIESICFVSSGSKISVPSRSKNAIFIRVVLKR